MRIELEDYPQVEVVREARRLHWKMLDTTTIGGEAFSSHVCPECAHVIRPPKVDRLEGEVELF